MDDSGRRVIGTNTSVFAAAKALSSMDAAKSTAIFRSSSRVFARSLSVGTRAKSATRASLSGVVILKFDLYSS